MAEQQTPKRRRVTYAYFHPYWHPEEWTSIVNAARIGGDSSGSRAERYAETRYLKTCAHEAVKARAAIATTTNPKAPS